MTAIAAHEKIESTSAQGKLCFAHIGGKTVATQAAATSPLRLLTPNNPGSAAWAFTSSYGGGLVAGDHVQLQVNAERTTTCYVSTQSATKVYRSVEDRICRQTLGATIADDALLVLMPDPVVCYADARYEQTQRFDLAAGGSLVMLDWFTSGRHGRGECWQAATIRSRNEIFMEERCLVRDALYLHRDCRGPERSMALGMESFNCFATLVLIGHRIAPFAKELVQWIAGLPVRAGDSVLIGASALQQPETGHVIGAVVRAAGPNVEQTSQLLLEKLGFLEGILGECPWKRKW